MRLVNFVSVVNGVLLIVLGIAFYVFSARTASMGIYAIGALLAFWAFIKTRSLNVKYPSIDNDSAQLKAHYVQKSGVGDRLEEVLAAFSMAVVWPAYLILIFFVGIASAAISPSDDKKIYRGKPVHSTSG